MPGGARGAAPRPLVLLRHGQSAGNLEGRFGGWDDDALTGERREEARRAYLARPGLRS